MTTTIQELQQQLEELQLTLAAVQVKATLVESNATLARKNAEDAYKVYMTAKQQMHEAISASAAVQKEVKDKSELLTATQGQIAAALEAEEGIERLKEMFEELDAYFAQDPHLAHTWQNFLAPYQKEDTLALVKCYLSGYHGFLNTNDMGLGKTVEAAIGLEVLKEEFVKIHGRKPIIMWATKKSLVKSSLKEVKRFSNLNLVPMQGIPNVKDRTAFFEMILTLGADGIICNYEMASTTPVIGDFHFDFIVVDEVHKLKGGASSKPTQIFKTYQKLCANAKFLIFLSGTPMVNKAQEMWAYLNCFDPVRFDNFRRFERIFTMYDPDTLAITINADALMKSALPNQMIRRKKDEVGIQLPALIREVRLLEMLPMQRTLQNMLMSEFSMWVSANTTADGKINMTSMLAQLIRQRQVSVYPAGIKYTDPETGVTKKVTIEDSVKIDETMDLIDEITDAGENVVVFCNFNDPLFKVTALARERGLTAECVAGDSTIDIEFIESQFQDNKIQVLCMNAEMGVGLNLQKNPIWNGGANHAIMMDLWWSPARNEQCEARIHRQGAFDACTIHILECEDSVDQLIVDILEEKIAAFASVLEKKELRPLVELKQKYPHLFGGTSD